MTRLMLSVLISYTIVSLVGYQTAACMKSEEPRPQPTETPDVSGVTTTSAPSKVNCSSNDTYYGKCKNDGYCVVQISGDSRKSNCQCVGNTYTGTYCERRARREYYKEAQMGSVYAVVGVAVLVFIAIVIGVACIIRLKYRKANEGESVESPAVESPAEEAAMPLNPRTSQVGGE